MTIITDIARELFSMFVADARLTLTTLLLVAMVAALFLLLRLPPLAAGAMLAIGCLAILVEATVREAKRR